MSMASREEGRMICGRKSAARRIGPATSCGKKAMKTAVSSSEGCSLSVPR